MSESTMLEIGISDSGDAHDRRLTLCVYDRVASQHRLSMFLTSLLDKVRIVSMTFTLAVMTYVAALP